MIVLPPVLMVNDERDLLWLLMEWHRRVNLSTATASPGIEGRSSSDLDPVQGANLWQKLPRNVAPTPIAHVLSRLGRSTAARPARTLPRAADAMTAVHARIHSARVRWRLRRIESLHPRIVESLRERDAGS